ncbi:unnamed protein product [Clonostachys solani]|uniref:Uncharacterized protein n=1 Tax=Clonostachys solani TaxID=160281 RepID=A0A9N9ZE05_9HYPO|nr:unnamed protein product [Clonostachys solani]
MAGILMLPPRSVPMPRREPLMATMTPSPPELPPAVHNRLTGFIVLPKTLLTLSRLESVCGTLVLATTTAPNDNRRSTRGLKHKDAKPVELSTPLMSKVSLTLTGKPCKGPRGIPCSSMYRSRNRARSAACANKGSVKQFVN